MHLVVLGVEIIMSVWCEEERSWISRREESDWKKTGEQKSKSYLVGLQMIRLEM